MREKLELRLQELKAEFESGQKALAELETKQTNLRNTLLRISGAIQVLEEELSKNNDDNGQPIKQSGPKQEVATESIKEEIKK